MSALDFERHTMPSGLTCRACGGTGGRITTDEDGTKMRPCSDCDGKGVLDSNTALVAWAAGLIEGEGTFGVYAKRGLRFIVRMTDREPLERLQRVLGGKLRGPIKPQKEHHKPQWEWQISAWRNAEAALQAIYPWLSPRRQAQADPVLLVAASRRELNTTCPQGHPYDQRYVRKDNGLVERRCSICARARAKAAYERDPEGAKRRVDVARKRRRAAANA